MTTLADAPPDAATAPSGTYPNAGLGDLLRLVARRDRIRVALWSAGIVGLVVATVASITGLYDTQEDLDRYADLVRDNAALIVQAGPGYGLQDPDVPATLGAVVMNEVGVWTILAVSLMSLFMVVRHTRTEEETGRSETIRALPVGRHAPLTAAIVATLVTNVAVAATVTIVVVAYDLPVAGSVAFGATLLGAGAVFTAVGAVAAQMASGSRAALGLGGLVLGVAYALRAVGDVALAALTWLSPIGWAQGIRAYADERWWVLLLPTAASIALFAAAFALQARRDLGAGILPDQPGPAVASPRLSSSWGLALRLQRTSVISWLVAMAVLSFLYGVIADEAEAIVEDNPEMEEFFLQSGQGTITEAFLAAATLILALIATGFTVSSVLRARAEEAAGRAEPVLAAPVARHRWVGSHLVVAVLGTVAIVTSGGLTLGFGYSAISGDWDWVGRMLGAALAMGPAMLVVGGVTMLAYGLSPSLALASWGFFAYVLVAGMLGEVLDLPQWALNLSPFQHVPALPAEPIDWTPIGALTALAAALFAVGVAALRRRDMS